MKRIKKLTAYEILQCLYVDDGAFPFGTRVDLQHGMELIYHFARFGLEMHIGCGVLESKTNASSSPPQFFPHLEKTNAAASTIQRAFRRAQGTASTRRGKHCGATRPPGPSIQRTSPLIVTVNRKLPHQMSCHRCFVPSKARQHIWCGDATHRKVRHICPRRLLSRKHLYPAQVTDTCAPLGNPIPAPPPR